MEKLDPALLREVSSEEIHSELNLEALVNIYNFQSQEQDNSGRNPVERILDGAYFPVTETQKFGREKLLGLLACNTSTYDDEIEDRLDEDILIKSIVHNKLSDPTNTDQYTRALRVRRSILKILFELELNPNNTKNGAYVFKSESIPCSAA